MTARQKAQAAKLRRIPDDAFAAEAKRRGFARLSVTEPIPVPKRTLQDIQNRLRGGIVGMAKQGEGYAMNALCVMGSVLNAVEISIATYEIACEAHGDHDA